MATPRATTALVGEVRRPPHPVRRVGRVFLQACLVWALGACTDGERPPPAPEPPPRQAPSLRLVVMTDLSGYLEPCGCQSRPLGGIDRAAAQLAALGGDGVPTALLAAGDLFFSSGGGGHAGGEVGEEAAAQQRMQAETLATILGQLGLRAATPGPSDLARGPDVVAGLAKRAGVTLVADGLSLGAGQPSVSGETLLEVGGRKLGVLGLSDAVEGGPSIERARAISGALAKQGAEIQVALISGEARVARRIAGAVEDLDFVIAGGTHRAEVTPPAVIGDAVVLGAGEHGQGLLVLEIHHEAPGPYRDVSEWSRAAERSALEERIGELSTRIQGWEKDPGADPALVQEQKRRLEAMRGELKAKAEPRTVRGNRFSARWIELGPEAPQDPEVAALMDEHDKRVNEHNRKALADRKPPPAPEGTPAYVGSQRCGDCHEEAFAWWRTHAHGVAYATLEERHKQFNLDCVGCHVTGYGRPGGSTVTHVEQLKDVGCESCHGPGSYHVDDVDVDEAQNVVREVAEPVCTQCHNEEHSDQFVYDEYRAKLIVPGHGKPAESAEL